MPTPSNGGVDQRARADLKGVRVLVVEDHWHIANALKRLLEAQGMVVNETAATTTAALRLASSQKPDVAVVDINLKGEMAYGLIDQLHDQGICVVVASGYAVPPQLKVACVLRKPLNGPELLEALRRALHIK